MILYMIIAIAAWFVLPFVISVHLINHFQGTIQNLSQKITEDNTDINDIAGSQKIVTQMSSWHLSVLETSKALALLLGPSAGA